MNLPPFVRAVMALACGIVFYRYCPEATWLVGVVAVLAFGALGIGRLGQHRWPVGTRQLLTGVGVLNLLVVLGWTTTWCRTARNDADNLVHLTDTLQAYEGVVAAQPEERVKTYRVELALRQGRWGIPARWQPLRGRVIVYLDKQAGPMPGYGEVWLVNGPPRPIDPPLNPGEFDYRQYLAYRGIYHQQYLRSFQRRVLGVDPPSRLTELAIRVNRWADGVLTRAVGSRREYAIVNAMILGVRDDLSAEQYTAYAAAGAVHILSVSGLHVGILFLVLAWLINRVAGKRHDRVWLIALQLAILWFYALVTGFSLPVLRSAAMVSLVLIATAKERPLPLMHTLSVAAFGILLYDPYALFSPGFQLSCLAVAGIGAWQSPLYQAFTVRTKAGNWLWNMSAVALVAQLATFPLGVYYFHQFPTYFLLANPFVMVASMVLLPLAMATLALCWVPYLNDWLGWALHKMAWLLNLVIDQTGQLPGASWSNLWLSPAALLLVYAVILCAAALLLSRNPLWTWPTLASAVMLAVVLIQDDHAQLHQRRLAVHFLPHRTAVSFTEGNRSLLLTDLDQRDERSYAFYLKNTFGQWGIADPDRRQLYPVDTAQHPMVARHLDRDYSLWVWHGTSVLLINRLTNYPRWQLPAVVDYVIIRRNAVRDWAQLRERVVARHIVFDDSNRTPLTDRLLAEARQQRIRCFSVRQMGAYVAELP